MRKMLSLNLSLLLISSLAVSVRGMASGKSMMRNPMAKSMPTQRAMMVCPRKYAFMPFLRSAMMVCR